MTERRIKWMIGFGAALFVCVIVAVSVGKWLRLGFNGFDLAIYNQTLWNTIHGRLFANSINPPIYLSDHAEWPLILLAPLYALAPHPLTLVFFQAVALAIGAVPVWLIAKRFNPNLALRTLWTGLYLANPFVWNLALSEFHMIAFAIPLIFFAAWFYIEKKYWRFLPACVAILLVREDMAFVVAGFGLMALIDTIRRRDCFAIARNDVLKFVIIPIAMAIVAFVLDKNIIAYFNPDGAYKFLTYYSWLGASPFQVVMNALTHPWLVINHIATPKTLEVVLVCLLPFLFLPPRRPRWLLLALLPAAEFGLVGFGIDMIMVKMQYIAPFVPPLFLAAMDGHAALEQRGQTPLIWRLVPRPIFPLLLVIATVVIWFFYGPGLGIGRAFSAPEPRLAALREAVRQIPPDAPVVSSLDALAPLSSRKFVWPTSYVWSGKKQFGTSDYVLPTMPEYIVLDQEDLLYFVSVYPRVDWAKPFYAGFDANLRRIIADGDFGIVFEKDGVALLKRGQTHYLDEKGSVPFSRTMPFVSAMTKHPAIAHPADQALGPIKYLGWNEPALPNKSYRLYFSAQEKISGQPLMMIDGKINILGSGLYGPAEWKGGEIIEIENFDDTPPSDLKLIKAIGGLFANGDGSLSLKVKTDPWSYLRR
jgi:uncharacterized membrane protein